MVGRKNYTCIEIVPKSEFYDYKRKYTKNLTEFILPARISSKTLKETQEASLKSMGFFFKSEVFVARTLIVSKKDQRPYFLEINTLPALTEFSLLPKSYEVRQGEFFRLHKRSY